MNTTFPNCRYRLRFFSKLRSGLSLIEMSFVLIVMTLILSGALATATVLYDDSLAKEESQRIVRLAQNIRQLKKSTGYDYSAGILEEVIELKLVPDGIKVENNVVLRNQWNGTVSITRQDNGGNVAITYENVPKRVCALMIKAIPPGLLFSVGPGLAGAARGASDRLISKLTNVDIVTACDTGEVHWSTGGNINLGEPH